MLWLRERQTRCFKDYVERKKKEYGDKFNQDDLNPDFIKAYESQQRIKVNFGYGVKTGKIGLTTGFRPSFLLILRSDSRGSIWVIDKTSKIIS
jgi:hypothetical protein